MAKLQRLKQNPNNIGEEMRDPRFLQVMSVLLGIDMSFGAPGEGEGSVSEVRAEHEEDTPMPDARPSSAAAGGVKKQPEPEPEPEPEDEEAAAKSKAKEEAEAEKKLGTENYKKRQFDTAIEHYGKAWELHKDITYLTNMSAAQFEKGDYEAAIETCKKAIEEGREVLADFKIIAKYVIASYFMPCFLLTPPGPLDESVLHMKSSEISLMLSSTIKSHLPSTAHQKSLTNSEPLRKRKLSRRRTHTSVQKRPTKRVNWGIKSSKKLIGLVQLKPTLR